MTQLIDPSDPRYFQLTNDKPYDRHNYKIVFTSGKTIISDDYMQVLGAWFENDASFLSHVEILDKEKGFSSK